MSRSSTTALTPNSETFGLVAVTIAFRWIRGTAGPTLPLMAHMPESLPNAECLLKELRNA